MNQDQTPDPSVSPHKRRSYNLLLMLFLLALAGIAAYVLLEQYYGEAATEGDPERAQFELDAQIKSLEPVTRALEDYYLAHQTWPATLTESGLEPDLLAELNSLQWDQQGQLRFGGSEALGRYQTGAIVLAPLGVPGEPGFAWQCRGEGIAEAYLPSYCQAIN